jgi:glycosyltransferase involved in cell wall biosynthesis
MNDVPHESARQVRLIEDAFDRGQAALAAGDKPEATRWLERAHRLAPAEGTITLVLATAAIGDDNAKAAKLFAEVLASADVRDAWFGLATARMLMGDLPGASAAVAEVLGRHAFRPDIIELAAHLAKATKAPGWCGLTSAGAVVVHPADTVKVDVRIDGTPLSELNLPAGWARAQSVTVTETARHLIGSPISLSAIGRVEGQVEAGEDGLRGWAWCPGDPDADPGVSVGVGRAQKAIGIGGAATGIRGLPPLARPRSFAVSWSDLPGGDAPVRVRGRDGRDLQGSPISRGSAASKAAVPVSVRSQRRRQDLTQWRHNGGQEAAVLVTHADGGGVERRVQASVACHEAQGRRAIVLRPAKSPVGGIVASSADLPDLQFSLPREQAAVLRLLRGMNPVAAELHHFLNHDPSVFEIIHALGVPYDAHVHDYVWFCPRIALVGRGDRYCGEPAPVACQSCVTELGAYLNEEIGVAALLNRSQAILKQAKQIIAPSDDAALRLTRHFPGIYPIVKPHEDDTAVPEPPPIPYVDGTVRVCVAGAIGLHKGFHVLLDLARDAKQRALDLSFVVAGTTIDDQRLIDTGRVFVTGPYQPDEAVDLIRAQGAALALLPSIWPETWCLGLTELWRAGLRVAAFDIGAPAERIRRTGRGFLFPLSMAPSAINDTLLQSISRRSLLPIRCPSAYNTSC